MPIDYTGAEGGRLGLAFASGCAATWVFVRNLVMKPAIKSCNERCTDLEKAAEWLKEQIAAKDTRIAQLETVLLTHGTSELRAAMQAVISETRVAVDKIGSPK
jgi:hypothetical protein